MAPCPNDLEVPQIVMLHLVEHQPHQRQVGHQAAFCQERVASPPFAWGGKRPKERPTARDYALAHPDREAISVRLAERPECSFLMRDELRDKGERLPHQFFDLGRAPWPVRPIALLSHRTLPAPWPEPWMMGGVEGSQHPGRFRVRSGARAYCKMCAVVPHLLARGARCAPPVASPRPRLPRWR